MSFRLGGLRCSDLAVTMECPLTAHRTQDNRRIQLRTKQLDGHVQAADVNESLCAQLIPAESISVGLQRVLAVDTGHEISPVSRGNNLLSRGLKVEHVERI